MILNAKEHAKVFYCRHMLPGIAGYDVLDKTTNTVKSDNLYIDTDTMKKSLPSFVGKPVFVQHKVNVPVNEIEDLADGYVIESFYNELDGWAWAKILVTSDAGLQAVERKWSVSNAYLPKTWEGKGQHLSLDYDRKLSDYAFTHLAIVPNPRYEQALIYTPEEFKAYKEAKRSELEELHNSKPEPKETAMNIFRNKKEAVKADDIQDTDLVEIKNDDGSIETVTVAELKAAKKAEIEKLNAKTKKNEKEISDDDEIEVDGEKVNMADLKTCYMNSKKMKKNDDAEAAKAKEAEEKKNADEAKAKEEAEKAEKENAAKKLEEITNAHKKAPATGVKIHTQIEGAKLGQSRYTHNTTA